MLWGPAPSGYRTAAAWSDRRRRRRSEKRPRQAARRARVSFARHPGPQINISAWVLCMRWCAEVEFQGSATVAAQRTVAQQL